MTLSERIQTILDEAAIDQVTLGKAAGVTKGTVNQWLSGDIKSIKLEYAVGIQDAYGYNAVWIVMGKGSKKAVIQHNDDWNPIPIPQSAYRKIPVVSMAKLGDNGNFVDMEYPVGHGDGYLHFFSIDPNAYGLRCVGDSMEPRIKDGEFVVIEPNHPVTNGDEVLVKSKDGRVMVKILGYSRDGYTHCLSVNQSHKTIKIPAEEIEELSFVAAIVKASAWRPD
jgi:phage repressor protein C with HTH and peptisase S24 domain